jgi:hypothetical protein
MELASRHPSIAWNLGVATVYGIVVAPGIKHTFVCNVITHFRTAF